MNKSIEEQIDKCILFLRINKTSGINIQLETNPQKGKRIYFPGNLGLYGVCMDIPEEAFDKFPEEIWKEAQYSLIMEALQRRMDGVET